MALKAQAQCRATLETLAEIKNPQPTAFLRQANIAYGPQQVNNGVRAGAGEAGTPRARKTMKSDKSNYCRRRKSGWTPVRRAQQGLAIQRWRPWQHSTGPKTAEGKARSSRNSDRGAYWRIERETIKRLRAALRAQRDSLAEVAPEGPRARMRSTSG